VKQTTVKEVITMTVKEMKEFAKKAFEEKYGNKPVEDLTKVANAGSTHDPKQLPKPTVKEE
jgi:hypothetical protein